MKANVHKETPPLNYVWGVVVVVMFSWLAWQAVSISFGIQNVMAAIGVGFIGVVCFLAGIALTIMIISPIDVVDIETDELEEDDADALLAKRCNCETSTLSPFCDCK